MRRPSLARTLLLLVPPGLAVLLPLSGVPAARAQSPAPAEPARLPPATAEPAAPLTLQQALALALSANADLAVAAREIEATQAAVLQSKTRPNPELSALIEDTRAATRTTTLLLSQPIEMGGKRAARIGAAERGRDVATADLRARRAELRATVVVAFRAVLAAQERVKLASDSAELARRASDAAAKRVQAGKVAPVEETKARVAEAGARLDAAQAQSQLRVARQGLSATWGNHAPRFERAEPTGAADELPPLPAQDSLAARVAASPAMMRAQTEVQRRQALTELEQGKRVPDLSVSLGVKRDAQAGRTQAIVGLAIPLPVFDTNYGGLQEALRREDKARDELAATQLRLHSDALQALERLAALRSEVQMLRDDVLPGAQSAYDVAVKGFELGKFGFLDVLDAQRTLFETQSRHLRAQAEAQRAAAEIDRLLGDPNEGVTSPLIKP